MVFGHWFESCRPLHHKLFPFCRESKSMDEDWGRWKDLMFSSPWEGDGAMSRFVCLFLLEYCIQGGGLNLRSRMRRAEMCQLTYLKWVWLTFSILYFCSCCNVCGMRHTFFFFDWLCNGLCWCVLLGFWKWWESSLENVKVKISSVRLFA